MSKIYYLYDGHGSVKRVHGKDGSTFRMEYDTYGNLVAGIVEKWHAWYSDIFAHRTVSIYAYSGERYNCISELQYLRARWYDTDTGRFISEDSYLGTLQNPLTRNRYIYTNNNPVNYVDPSGHNNEFLGYMADPSNMIVLPSILPPTEEQLESTKDMFLGIWASCVRNLSEMFAVPSGVLKWLNEGRYNDFNDISKYTESIRNYGQSYLEKSAEEAEDLTSFYIGTCLGDVLTVLVLIGVAKRATSATKNVYGTLSPNARVVTPEGFEYEVAVEGEAVLVGVLGLPPNYYNEEEKSGIEKDLENLWNSITGQGYKGGSKTIDDIIGNLPETTNGKGVARNFESTGGFDQTIKDFDALNPIDVKEIQTQYGPGKVGKLSDGTTVVARPGSTTGGATLEIRVSNSKVYKIRY